MPRVERVSARLPEPQALDAARAALREGGRVLLPTETAYVVATRASGTKDADAVRLAPSAAAVVAETGPLPRTARALADRFWPGPLALLLDGRAWRVPGLHVTRLVLEGAPATVALAASSGAEPATLDAALAATGGQVDLALDAGPALLARPATVVSVAAERYEVVREGWLSKDQIGRALARTVLFVCTGNTCRSPMAEAIFKTRLARRLGVERDALEQSGFTVRSAGTSAMQGGPAADQAVLVMGERGIPLAQHRSRALTPALVDEAEVIFVMSSSHARTIEEWFPEAASKVRLLDPSGVPDPVGQSVERYRETADHLEQRIEEALDELL